MRDRRFTLVLESHADFFVAANYTQPGPVSSVVRSSGSTESFSTGCLDRLKRGVISATPDLADTRCSYEPEVKYCTICGVLGIVVGCGRHRRIQASARMIAPMRLKIEFMR